MNIRKNKNCNIKINDKSISNKSAKEQFEKLGYEERLKRIVNLQDDKEETIYYKIYDEDVKAIEYILNQNQQLKNELKAVSKGLKKVVLKRKKWKTKYQKNRHNWKLLEEFVKSEIERLDKYMKSLNYLPQGDLPITYYRAECKKEAKEKVLSKMQEIGGSNE